MKFLEETTGYELKEPVDLPSEYSADVCIMNVGTYQRILFLIPFGSIIYTIEVDKDLTKEMYVFQDDTFFYKMSEVKEFVSKLQENIESLANPERFPFNELIVYSCY